MPSSAELLQELGGREQVRKDLRSKRDSRSELSKQYDELARAHPREWVAFHDGRMAALGTSLDDVLERVDEKNIRRGRAVIRFVDPEPKVWIL